MLCLLHCVLLLVGGCAASPIAPVPASTGSAAFAIADADASLDHPPLKDDLSRDKPDGASGSTAARGPKALPEDWHGLILFTSKSCRFCGEQIRTIENMPGWKLGQVGDGPLHVVQMDQAERRDDLLRWGVGNCDDEFLFPQLIAIRRGGERVAHAIGTQDAATIKRLYRLTGD